MRRTALPILLFSLAVPLTLHAAPQLQPQGVVVTLSGEATKTVANDEALITFTVERRAATPEAVTEEVVTAGNKGLAALAKWDKNTVVVETSDFSTWPVYTRAREGEASMIGGWSARQTIRVTVRDVTKVSDVMKGAAETMQYDGITFRVSEASKKAAETELLDAALNDAKRRAGVIAKNFELTDDSGDFAHGRRRAERPDPLLCRSARCERRRHDEERRRRSGRFGGREHAHDARRHGGAHSSEISGRRKVNLFSKPSVTRRRLLRACAERWGRGARPAAQGSPQAPRRLRAT